ncbi:MAG TPA: conjugative transfer signal peptidase TraF [Telmatospirillum sp.]|nr:conjugative transfer signal peptidase TraF [Telmatospirillum sp.]
MIPPRLIRLERRRRGRNRPRVILALTMVGLGCVGFATLVRPAPLLLWNASASAPIGLYRVMSSGPIQRGDMVLLRTPDSVRNLAAERGYLPLTVPLVKRVAALAGDRVCAIGDDLLINGEWVARRLERDHLGRPLPHWQGCHRLGDEVFPLMAEVPTSFDGRYFGPVPISAVIGRLVPLWTK